MPRFEDMTIYRPDYLTNKQGKAQRSAVGQSNFEWVLSIFDELPTLDMQRIIVRAMDALPMLPADPSLYPAGGGLFKNGDATGYSLTRIYGNAVSTGNPIIDQMVRAFDNAPALPTDPAAFPGLPAGIYRDGNATGYRIVRMN